MEPIEKTHNAIFKYKRPIIIECEVKLMNLSITPPPLNLTLNLIRALDIFVCALLTRSLGVRVG